MRMADRIKQARLAKGLNQAQLAKLAGISQATVSEIETGTSKEPAAIHIWNIAQALRKPFRYLLTGVGAQDGLPDNAEEAELIVLYRNLNEANKEAWRASGEALLRIQTKVIDKAVDVANMVKLHQVGTADALSKSRVNFSGTRKNERSSEESSSRASEKGHRKGRKRTR